MKTLRRRRSATSSNALIRDDFDTDSVSLSSNYVASSSSLGQPRGDIQFTQKSEVITSNDEYHSSKVRSQGVQEHLKRTHTSESPTQRITQSGSLHSRRLPGTTTAIVSTSSSPNMHSDWTSSHQSQNAAKAHRQGSRGSSQDRTEFARTASSGDDEDNVDNGDNGDNGDHEDRSLPASYKTSQKMSTDSVSQNVRQGFEPVKRRSSLNKVVSEQHTSSPGSQAQLQSVLSDSPQPVSARGSRPPTGLVRCDIDFSNLFQTINDLWDGLQNSEEALLRNSDRLSEREEQHEVLQQSVQEINRQLTYADSNFKSHRADFSIFSEELKGQVAAITSRLESLVEVPVSISRIDAELRETSDLTKESYKLGLDNKHDIEGLNSDLTQRSRTASAKYQELFQLQQQNEVHGKLIAQLESDLASRARAEEKADKSEVAALQKRLQALEIFMQSKASQTELESLSALPGRVDQVDIRALEQRRQIESLHNEIVTLKKDTIESNRCRVELEEKILYQQAKQDSLAAENRLLRSEMLELEERRRMLQQIVDGALGVGSSNFSQMSATNQIGLSSLTAIDAKGGSHDTVRSPSRTSEANSHVSGDLGMHQIDGLSMLSKQESDKENGKVSDIATVMSDTHSLLTLSNIRVAPNITSLTQAVELLLRDKADATTVQMLDVKTRLMDGEARRLALTLRAVAARVSNILQTFVTLVLPSTAATISLGGRTEYNTSLVSQSLKSTPAGLSITVDQRVANGLTSSSLASSLADNVTSLTKSIEAMLNVVEAGTRWARARLRQRRQERRERKLQRDEQRKLLLQSGVAPEDIEAAIVGHEEADEEDEAAAEEEEILMDEGASAEYFPPPSHDLSVFSSRKTAKSKLKSKSKSMSKPKPKSTLTSTRTLAHGSRHKIETMKPDFVAGASKAYSDTEGSVDSTEQSEISDDDSFSEQENDEITSHQLSDVIGPDGKPLRKSAFARFATREFVSEQIATMTAALTAFMSATRKEFQYIATGIALNSAANAAAEESAAQQRQLIGVRPTSATSVQSIRVTETNSNGLRLIGMPVSMKCAVCSKTLEGNLGHPANGVYAGNSISCSNCTSQRLNDSSLVNQETMNVPIQRRPLNTRPRTAVPYARTQRSVVSAPTVSHTLDNVISPSLNLPIQPKTGTEALRALRSLAHQLEARADAYELETAEALRSDDKRDISLAEAAADSLKDKQTINAHNNNGMLSRVAQRNLSATYQQTNSLCDETALNGKGVDSILTSKVDRGSRFSLESLSPAVTLGSQRISLYEARLSPSFPHIPIHSKTHSIAKHTQNMPSNHIRNAEEIRLGPGPSPSSLVQHRISASDIENESNHGLGAQLVVVKSNVAASIRSGTRPSTAIGLKSKQPPKSLVTY